MTRAAGIALLSLLASFMLPAPVRAATPGVELETRTWTELRDDIKAGKSTILVPIGGTEQNGPHMALGKHNVRVKALAARIAGELGNALVAPVIAYVPEGSVEPPTEHMRFPGTITVSTDAFEKVLESAARSFRHHGFRDIVLLGDHGGYQASLRRVAERLNREWVRSGAHVHALPEYYDAVEKAYPASLAGQGFNKTEIGLHAGLADTALTLAIDPGVVRVERLGQKPGVADGVRGDPSKATADLGRPGVDLIVRNTVDAIRRATRK